jgi:hypothetical protein
MQPGIKYQSKMYSPPTNHVVNATARSRGKAATTKRSFRRQTTAPHTLTDANQRPSRTRSRAAGICKDVRGVKVNTDVPPPLWTNKLEGISGGHNAEVEEVVRTETCSAALSALVMATARPMESEVRWASQGPPQNHQNGLYSTLHRDPLSIHQVPLLQYPIPPSISMSLPSQDQPVTTDTRMQTIEGQLSHPTRSPSRASPLLHPRHQSPSMAYPPCSPNSTYFTAPRPSLLARSLSWIQYPSAPFTEHAAPAFVSSPDPAMQAFQAPCQDGDTMDYPYSNRMSPPRNFCRAFPLAPDTISSEHHQQSLTAYTEDYHHLTFDPGQWHMDHPPSVNSYSSPTSTPSFTSVTSSMNATTYPCSPSAGDGAGQ